MIDRGPTVPWDSSRLDRWRPARKHPETYPGDRPDGSYVLLDDWVCSLLDDDRAGARVLTPAGEAEPLDEVLDAASLPALADRIAVLAYAGNRNPATLAIKLDNYGYACPGTRVALPVLRGTIDAADVAACGLSGQGYLYGDLLVDDELVGETRCEAWVALADPDQLRVLNESEIGTGDYVGALFDGVRVAGQGGARALAGPVLGYAALRGCFVSPRLGAPLAFRTIDAERRALPEMTPMQMLDHVLDAAGLRDRAAAITSSPGNGDLADAVACYMNRNWWRRFTGAEPDSGYGRLLALVESWMAGSSLERSTASILDERGHVLSADEAQHPDTALTWGRL